MSLKDGDPSAATDHHHKVETVSPLVLHLSINLLKVETVSPWVFHLSMNLLKGGTSKHKQQQQANSSNDGEQLIGKQYRCYLIK